MCECVCVLVCVLCVLCGLRYVSSCVSVCLERAVDSGCPGKSRVDTCATSISIGNAISIIAIVAVVVIVVIGRITTISIAIVTNTTTTTTTTTTNSNILYN